MNNLMKLRIEKGLTRPELAKLSDVPASTIHKLEIGANDMRGAKADTLYKLANALDTSVEYLLEYYLSSNVGTKYEDAELKAVLVYEGEWQELEWKDTGLRINYNTYKDTYDIAKALGYTLFSRMNTLDYCYIKDNSLYVFREIGNMHVAKLPRKPQDAIENDGVICNGTYIRIKSYEDYLRKRNEA